MAGSMPRTGYVQFLAVVATKYFMKFKRFPVSFKPILGQMAITIGLLTGDVDHNKPSLTMIK